MTQPPLEAKHIQRRKPSRRALLKLTGALAATTAATALNATANADDGTPDGAPPSMSAATASGEMSAMASMSNQTFAGDMVQPAAVNAPLPPLRVIALTRLAFGPSLNDSEGWNATAGATEDEKFVNWVTSQLNPAFDNGVYYTDATTVARIQAANLPTLGKSLPQLWTDHMRNPAQNADLRREDPAEDVYLASFIRAVYSKWQLFELLTDFWHNHFNVHAWDYSYAMVTWVHYNRDVIRANALGNFRTMLGAVAKSPAMLFYLDNYINTNAGPNENWARESFELHALGAENYDGVKPYNQTRGFPNPTAYVDADVYNARECFTGWRVNDEKKQGDGRFKDDGTFLFDSSSHTIALKRVLNKEFLENNVIDPSDPDFSQYGSIPEHEGLRVLDMLAKNPGTGRFIVRKLWRRFVGDTVPPAGVPNAFFDSLAALWTANWQNPNQIRIVLQEMLTGALSPFKTTFGDKIKRPFEAAISMLRSTAADFRPDKKHWDFSWYYKSMGQDLFDRRPPDGYPDVKTAWNNTTSMLMRWRFCNWMMEEGVPQDRSDIKVDLFGWTIFAINGGGANRTPASVADWWIGAILGRPMLAIQSRKAVVDMLARGSGATSYQLSDTELRDRVPDAVALVLMSPDFQLR